MLTADVKQSNESQAVVESLGHCAPYPEPTTRVEQIETHISWVFLTDRFVYKLKKPVRYEFLDFSTPEMRREACEQEVRLNRRLAPDVYLGVIPITVDKWDRVKLGGTGTPVDWVVKMRRLPADRSLDQLIHDGQLQLHDVDALARTLAEFYRRLPPLTLRIDQYRRQIEQHVQANYHQLLSGDYQLPISVVNRLHERQVRLLRLAPDLLDNRVRDGRIVEGHGDLRPEHIYFNSHPTIIDCIEFNKELRSLDVLDELAFLAMECDLMGEESIGVSVIDHYQRTNGDRPPEALFEFYKLYRACVRAKILSLRSMQVEPSTQSTMLQRAEQYLHLGEKYSDALGPSLLVMVCGLPGSGKSTLATTLADSLDVELLQTDVIRRQLFGPSETSVGYCRGRYRAAARARVHQEMFRRASVLLDVRRSVVLDGTFLSADLHSEATELAKRYGAETLVVRCDCPVDVARERIADRIETGTSLSDARPDFYERQRLANECDPPGLPVLNVDTTDSQPAILKTVFAHLRRLLLPATSP